MANKESDVTAGSKVTSFLNKNKILFVILLACLCVALIAFIIISKISASSKEKSLSRIDEISFALTDGSASLSDGELEERQLDALDSLSDLTGKGGIVGARANMLCAELSYQLQKYEDSVNYWKAVADKSKKNYLHSIAMYNLGAMYEQLSQKENAAESYKAAYEDKNCLFAAHAGFSYARVLESLGKYGDAAEVYQKLNDDSPSDSWAKLAKTRIIALRAEKKID